MTTALAYEIHPLAELIPAMSDQDFAELKTDIERNGLRQPITLYEAKILDGRHRQAACSELGIEPAYVQYEGEDPASYVISLNLYRRHLTTGQRSAAALKLLDYEKEQAKARQGTRTDLQPTSAPTGAKVDEHDTKATAKAGEKFGVSRSTVERARRVAKERPDLMEKVEAGDVTVNDAFNQATGRPKRERQFDLTKENNQRRATKQRERLWKLLAALEGARIGLETFDLLPALALATAEEVEEMDRTLADCGKAFRKLRTDIQSEKGP
jgi:hypothetical protein